MTVCLCPTGHTDNACYFTKPVTLPCLQYNLPFYLQYLAKWPEYCVMAEGPAHQAMGYSAYASAASRAAAAAAFSHAAAHM